MSILVTGGTGFIGSHLVERLRRTGHTVKCVAKDRLNAAFLESLGVDVVLDDIMNGVGWDSILDDVDYVYHLAGVTRAKSWREYYEGNYDATKRFVEICRTHCHRLKRFVYVSSLSAVGPALDGSPVSEGSAYHPVSHYGKSKMLGELEVLKAENYLPITIIRPSAVYGPRERDFYGYMRIVLCGVQPLIGFGTKRLNLIHSTDLVDGIVLAAGHERGEGEIYNVGSETDYTTHEIGDAMAKAARRHAVRLRVPHALVYALGATAEVVARLTGRQIIFNLQKVKESVQTAWSCSVEKARTQLGFCQRVSLEDGMRRTYQWYCDNGWL